MVKVNELIIDELVAGSLHGEQYRRVLKALDEQPDGWKQCALAFLHEQALEKELHVLSSEDGIWEDSPRSPVDRAESHVKSASVIYPQSAPRHLEWMTRVTSIAALLLVSFTIGWSVAGIGGTTPTEVAGDGVAQGPTPAGSSSREAAPPTFGETSGELQYVSDNGLIPLESSPPRILQELESRGAIDVESFDALVPIQDGDSIRLVPVQRYRVRPKVYPY